MLTFLWLSVLIQFPDDIHEPSMDAVGQALYFEVLELQPIKLSLSFMRTERVNSEEKSVHPWLALRPFNDQIIQA